MRKPASRASALCPTSRVGVWGRESHRAFTGASIDVGSSEPTIRVATPHGSAVSAVDVARACAAPLSPLFCWRHVVAYINRQPFIPCGDREAARFA